ncbi:MAG: alpha-amylase family glycosyl hydrolase, partial [Rubrobacteraceae bacterium]
VLGNHDNPRIASRMDHPRLAAMLLLTLRGAPTVYYGDEIGMTDADIPPGMAKDPQSENNPHHNRDPERTPMQWDAGKNAGFSNAEPWLPVSDASNVEAQRKDPRSILSFFRRLIESRKESPALTVGSYRPLDAGNRFVLAYVREYAEQRILVALNFGSEYEVLDVSREADEGEVLLSTSLDRDGGVSLGKTGLRPREGIMISLGP